MKKILVVEDNEKNLKLISALLQSQGCETIEAKDGEEGIILAKKHLPNLILMDVQMPKIDGSEALNVLRAEAATKDIPIVAITSYAMGGDKERFLEQGFDSYISKPIHVQDVIETLKKYIRPG